MPVTTSQQISRYYQQFHAIEVTFTKEVIKATHLYSKQVYIKCLGYHWPCIVYSSSMSGAKVIMNITTSLRDALRKSNNMISLRFSFLQPDKSDALAFFVGAKIAGSSPYGEKNPELSFVTISFTQRPPDDLIEILGELLEANVNSRKRSEERIVVTSDSLRKLGLGTKGALLTIEQVPRKCIIRDLSFSGAKVIIVGLAKFLVNRTAVLRLQLADDEGQIELVGKVVRFEPVEGRTDIAAFAIQFDEDKVPIKYKMKINSFLRTVKIKPARGADSGGAQIQGKQDSKPSENAGNNPTAGSAAGSATGSPSPTEPNTEDN
ncbi:MAG: PilZN3 domain-containing protein [Spirochaetia bacterium]